MEARVVLTLFCVAGSLVPTAVAASSQGEFGLRGLVEFEGLVAMGGDLIAGYGRPPRDARLLHADSVTTRVTRYEAGYVEGVSLATSPHATARLYENLTWTMYGGRAGYVALLPAGAAIATITTQDAVVETRNRTLFGVVPVGTTTRPEGRTFSREIDHPHFVHPRSAAAVGPLFQVKIYGPRLVIQTARGPETIETGRFPDPSVPLGAKGKDVWAVLEVHGNATLFKGANVALAFAEAAVSWSGAVEFEAQGGVLQAEGTHTLGEPGRVRLEGAFSGRLVAGKDETPRFAFEGELLRATYRGGLVAVGTFPLATVADPDPLPALGLVALAVVAGYALRRHRRNRRVLRPTPAITAEDCHAEAALAIEKRAWTVALAWVRRGRRLAPSSARLAHDEAFVLEALGSREAALAAYAEAAALGGEAFSAFGAARSAASLDRPADEIVGWLVRALAEDPGLAVDVLCDPRLASHADDPRIVRYFENDGP